jgi:hypothetical protein
VYNLLSQINQIKSDDRQTLRAHIGFVLTILEREGKISRTGKGKIGDTYLYSSRKFVGGNFIIILSDCRIVKASSS